MTRNFFRRLEQIMVPLNIRDGMFWDLAILISLTLMAIFSRKSLQDPFVWMVSLALLGRVFYRECNTTTKLREYQPPFNLSEDDEITLPDLDEENQVHDDVPLQGPPQDLSDYGETRHFGVPPVSSAHSYSPREFWQDAVGNETPRGQGIQLTRGFQMAPLHDMN